MSSMEIFVHHAYAQTDANQQVSPLSPQKRLVDAPKTLLAYLYQLTLVAPVLTNAYDRHHLNAQPTTPNHLIKHSRYQAS